ncbi:MAG: hypothetical protein LBH42_00535 [Treponema sp.]|jgi:transcription elongation factor Elf1|nr:hypothetical protein [Treponema sp.]
MAASVILARCSKHGRAFGIRVEKRGNDWVSTWAFPIDDAKAKREGFDRTKISGSFQPVDGYPGCPHCGADELVQCGCGRMICYKEGGTYGKSEKKPERKSENNFLRCPWCGVAIREIKEVESFTVKSGNY